MINPATIYSKFKNREKERIILSDCINYVITYPLISAELIKRLTVELVKEKEIMRCEECKSETANLYSYEGNYNFINKTNKLCRDCYTDYKYSEMYY